MRHLVLNEITTLPYSVEEALNRLRVNFGFCGADNKKVMVSSSVPNEGKSFIAVQLWRLLAESGKKVVFVDADMRKSILRNRHRIRTEDGAASQGLTYYLSGQASLEDVLYATNVPNGYMIPVMHTVSNPALLLQNERFPDLLDRLAKAFDYVIIDTPPVTAVADGNLVAGFCDGAIFVVRGGSTPRKLIASSLQQLENAGCKLLGVVLNRVQMSSSSYYYYKYNRNGYYYSKYYYGKSEENSHAEEGGGESENSAV